MFVLFLQEVISLSPQGEMYSI